VTPVESWIACLVGFSLAYRRDLDHAALAQHIKGLLVTAKPVFEKLSKGSTPTAELLIKSLGKGGVGDAKGMPRGNYAEYMQSLSRKLRPSLAKFYQSPEIDEPQVKLAKAAISMLSPDSARVDAKDALLDKNIGILPDRLLRQMCSRSGVLEHADQQKHLDELRALVKQHTGRKDTKLTPEETEALKAKNRDRFKHYNKLRKNVNDSWKEFVRVFCRERGGLAKVSELVPAMKKAGITVHPYDGYERLKVGENGALYTTTGNEIFSIVAADSQIKWNKAYDPKKDEGYVFMYKTPMQRDFRPAYTRPFLRRNKQARYAKVLKASEVVPQRRDKWLRDLKSADSTKQILGAMVELLYMHAMRVGGLKNNTDGKTTYGLSTLRAGHVVSRGGGYVLSYPGKKGVTQKHVVDSTTPEGKRICAVIAKCLRGKRKDDFLWTDRTGERIGSGSLNAYLRKIGVPVTAHKFRHIRGTELMKKLLADAKIPKGSNQKQVEKIVKGLAVKVGALLGHVSGDKVTPGTAIKSYIVPDVLSKFFAERGMRVPAWLPKSRASAADDE